MPERADVAPTPELRDAAKWFGSVDLPDPPAMQAQAPRLPVP